LIRSHSFESNTLNFSKPNTRFAPGARPARHRRRLREQRAAAAHRIEQRLVELPA
jgi:hypothetical protein